MIEGSDWALDGYAIWPQALPAETCERFGQAVIEEFERLNAAGWRFAGAGRMAGHLNIRMGGAGRDLFAAFEQAGLRARLERLCGEPLTLGQAVGNLNLPGSAAQDFHIDGAFGRRIVIANICLVASDSRNGATQVVPQSDQRAMNYWHFCREGWARRAIQPALKPGDVLVRPSNLWHRGMPNRSAALRPMAALTWYPPAIAATADACRDLDSPLTIFANKYSGRFSTAKEFTAVHMPTADHAIRLAKSLIDEWRR